jgi:lysophospholipase L1-like esterase
VPLLPIRTCASLRSRRPRFRVFVAVETLEVRSLLSSAVIQWSMAPQITLDPKHGNAPTLPNTPAYVNPSNGYGVMLDASHSDGILRTTTFSWTVTDPLGHATPLSGEDPSISLPQGPYVVKLTATGLRNSNQPLFATTDILVKDVLVVSIGDSYASGEGNPVVPGFYGFASPQWAFSPDPAMNRENADAHRSTLAAPAQFALKLQQSHPHEAVTFVSVANSGASIAQGLLGPMSSIGDPTHQLPAEIDELRQIIGDRRIDVLTIAVGANDIGFAALAGNLIKNTYSGSPTLASIQTQVDASLSALPQQFAMLGAAVKNLDPGQVLITEYPDLTRNDFGNVEAILGPLFVTLISRPNSQFAAMNIIAPLDAAVATAALVNQWTYVTGISADFHTHGYPAVNSWIRRLGESYQLQGTHQGLFHPNAAGHQAVAKRLLAAYRG